MRRLIELAGFKNHAGVRATAEMALATGNDALMRRMSRYFTSIAAARNAETHPFMPGPCPDELPLGDITIGNLDSDSGALMIPIQYFTEHAVVTGTTGMGKSWFVKSILLSLIEHGAHVWLPDTEDEYKDLALFLPPEKLWIFDISRGEFKRNCLQPLPGESIEDVIARNKDVWREMFLRDGSINMFSEIMHDLYRNHVDGFPTLVDFFECLPRYRYKLDSRRGQYMESLLNRTTNIVQSMSHTYDVIEGYDLGELMNRNIVFRLPGVSADIQEFFINELLAAVADYRLRCPDAGLLIVVLDEAHRFFSPGKRLRMDLAEPIIYDLMRTFRKRNAGVIISTQVPSELPASASANLGLRIVLRTIDGNCIKAVGDSMALDREQREYLPQLPERRAIVHYKGYPDPFMVEIPQLDFKRRISEAEIRQRMAPVFESLRWKARADRPTQARVLNAQCDMPVMDSNDAKPASNNMTISTNSRWMTKQLMDYLIEIANFPFEPATKRDERLGLSGYKGDRHRTELEKRGMIRMHKINTGKRGGLITLLETTDKAYEYLESIEAKVTKPKGKGGFIHAFWQNKVADLLKDRAEVWIEDSRSGKLVDVGMKKDGKDIAIEIALNGEEKELVNVAKDSEFYDKIIILTEKQKTSDSLREKLDELGKGFGEKVEIKLLRSFLNEIENNDGDGNRLTHILTPSPEVILCERELRARDELAIEDKRSAQIEEKTNKEK
jgi:hypothetical protein